VRRNTSEKDRGKERKRGEWEREIVREGDLREIDGERWKEKKKERKREEERKREKKSERKRMWMKESERENEGGRARE